MAADHTPPLLVGSFSLNSRLVVGTGKYETYEVMQDALAASGCDTVTVAVRRERLLDDQGRSLLDFLDTLKNAGRPATAGQKVAAAVRDAFPDLARGGRASHARTASLSVGVSDEERNNSNGQEPQARRDGASGKQAR